MTADISLLVPFIETTTPIGVTFNQWGVAQRGFRYTFEFRRLSVTFEVCALNGLWGGSIQIFTNTWGRSGPLTRRDFKFRSFEECTTHLWKNTYEIISSHSQEGNATEFQHYKKTMSKWLALSAEEKFNTFKEVDFYGS